jgi:phospholipid/cholesterol/gamma-HCH transport system substrate-binding protein
MDKERKAEIWVGGTVSVALIILLLGVMWGKGSNLFSKKTVLTVRFEDVRGLEEGDRVTMRGIVIGEVSDIVLGKQYADVRLQIKNGIPLFSDAQVFIEDKDLMGEKQISIFSGNGTVPFDRNGFLTGMTRVNMLDLLSGAEKLISQTGSLMLQLKGLMDQGRIEKVLRNVENSSNEANQMFVENRKTIRTALAQLEGVTRKLKEDSTAERFSRIISELDSTFSFVRRVATEVETEKGTLGKFLHDKKLYDHLVKTSSDLDSLIADIRLNPKRYIHVTVF